jgi:hypothetical protein
LKRVTAILLSVLCVVSLTSCAPASNDDALLTTPATDDTAIATLPPPIGDERMTELRVAIRYETDMNPLYPKHYATRSLLALVYDTLFRVDHEGKIVPDLAKSITYDVATMTYRIQIDDGKTFHSGKKLTAQDVRASLLKTISIMTADLSDEEPTTDTENGETDTDRSTVKDEDNKLSMSYEDGAQFQASSFSFMTSLMKKEYRNIRQVSTEGSDVILIELHRPDPHVIGLLTFPIISESDVNLRSKNPITGSGTWQIVSTENGRLVTLERVEKGSGIRRISAKAFDAIDGAMQAFDDGEIDVLVLDSSETSLYADRTRIRKQRIDYPGYVSLYFRDDGRDSALLWRDYMIREIRSDSKGDQFAAPFDRALFPLLPGDSRLQNVPIPAYAIGDLPVLELPDDEPEPTETIDDAGAPTPVKPDTREPFVLLVPDGFTPYRLVENIGACASRLGRRFVPQYVSEEEWTNTLSNYSYDAALLIDTSHIFLDPVDYLDGLQDAGLFDWTEIVDAEDVFTLREAQHLVSLPEGSNLEKFSEITYAQTVSRVFSSLPVLGLAITETMVLYGNNVENTMSGSWYSPYENVEELVVWRP